MADVTRVPGSGEGLFRPATPIALPRGGVSSAAAPWGSDLSPELVRARFSPCQEPTRLQLLNDNTNNAANSVQTITPYGINVDRPVVLVPIDNLNALGAGITRTTGTSTPPVYVGGVIRYGPLRRAPTIATGVDASMLYTSDAHGICYLSNPGDWYVYLDFVQASSVTQVTMLVIDASDSGTIARYLGEAGCHAISQPSHNANRNFLSCTAVSGIVCGANRDRSGLVIQNTGVDSASSASVNRSVRLGFGVAAINNGGVLLGSGSSMTLTGPQCWKGSIQAILDIAAVGSPVDIVVLEFL